MGRSLVILFKSGKDLTCKVPPIYNSRCNIPPLKNNGYLKM